MQRQSVCTQDILTSKEELVSQINDLQRQITLKAEEYNKELQTLQNENATLKLESKKASSDANDNMKLETLYLKEQIKAYDEKVKHLELQVESIPIKGENSNDTSLSSKISCLQEYVADMDRKYLEAKQGWDKAISDVENINTKLTEKRDQNRIYSERVTQLEMDLLKAKQQLAEAFNKMNE